jgi:predicted transcriptional regulator
MAQSSAPAKLRVRVGKHQFTAEGPAQAVTAQFTAFQQLVADDNIVLKGAASLSSHTENPSTVYLRKILRYDKRNKSISLIAHPTGERKQAEMILLLLLAYRHLLDEETVPVTAITRALRESGCKVSRVDRVLADSLQEGLVVKLGTAKGTKYRLTPKGLYRADEVAKQTERSVAEV